MKIRRPRKKKISLENKGNLSIFFTGVGSAFSKRNYQTNLIIIKGKDHLMIDIGSKTPQALYELGISVMDIQNFLITHSHADHIGGLEEVMLMNRYVRHEKANIIINHIYQHYLWDMSLRGGAAFNEEHEGEDLVFTDFWNIIRPKWVPDYPRETMEADIGGINVKLFRTMHIPDHPKSWRSSFWSCGVIIDERVMFSGDSRFDPELLESFDKMFNLEIIFHDCQFFTGGVHVGIDELGTLPEETRKKMILVHYGDNWEENLSKVRKYRFKGLAEPWVYYDFPEKG
jgi:ribonuclease BN (tRNA processing enzyme)